MFGDLWRLWMVAATGASIRIVGDGESDYIQPARDQSTLRRFDRRLSPAADVLAA